MDRVETVKVTYGGWPNCVRLRNGLVELVVTTDVGPRIIRFGFIGGENELCEIGPDLGLAGGYEWRLYGGHRLWHGPEDRERTYEPDNGPVSWEKIPGGIKTIQDVEPRTGIRKVMEISLSPEGSVVNILHRLTNEGALPVELFVWGITAMAPGGKEVVPQTRRDTGLLPNRVVSLWPYSRLDDPRVHWGERYITLVQNPELEGTPDGGVLHEDGWAAYFNHNHLFIKRYLHACGARYPDFGVSYETYVNETILELETLAPLVRLAPGERTEHEEEWELFDNVEMPSDDEEEIEEALKEKARSKK